MANESPGPKSITAIRTVYAAARSAIDAGASESVTLLASQLRLMMAAKGWDAQKFDGLRPKDKDTIIQAYSASNKEFAKRAWNRSWNEIFSPDEEAIRVKPRNVFRRQSAEPADLEEFDDFCRESADFVIEFLGRD